MEHLLETETWNIMDTAGQGTVAWDRTRPQDLASQVLAIPA